MNRLVATFFGVGYLRPAPGTWGSLAALPVAYAVLSIGGFWLLVNLTFFVFMSGWIATREITRGQEDHDPSYIVVDEAVGQWISLFPVGYGAMMMSVDLLALYPGWIAAFALFRLFDIWKPWLVGKADARGDALGVMLDDVIAGVFAALGVIALAALFHLVLM
ncbi:phosphatidylglycerophosphatase A family protein [Marivita geojedonensis]|uniref:Phosphatidylglycerophosphatase A n=1 Tax=Marivita geojedonensis TaxID=1123756 RepID=A0A1X4NNV7_9RHOB|nr:phosphatidylglycerophosphatase A [Marivita geojedonensis]OSQ52157.1 phosphatidylglycerophosphatase [Marivita geojedonensis]PRY81053.1 phosphatidylglycerophosphatase A [Marivita geojedonensis]